MRTIEVSSQEGVFLAVDVGGAAGAPPVILLHGGGQTRHAWRKTSHALIASGYQVAAYDLRGHGDSDWALGADYGLDRQVADLQAVMAIFVSPPVLVGASFGGLIALATAGANPGAVAALVLVDVAPRVDREGEARIIEFMRAYPDGFASVEEAADAIATYLPHRPRPRDLSGLKRNLRERDGRWCWHWDPQLFDGLDVIGGVAIDRFEDAARGLVVPTLLVRGMNSELVDDRLAEEFMDLVPHARRVDVQDAHHMVSGDRNDAFNSAVKQFLDDHWAALNALELG